MNKWKVDDVNDYLNFVSIYSDRKEKISNIYSRRAKPMYNLKKCTTSYLDCCGDVVQLYSQLISCKELALAFEIRQCQSCKYSETIFEYTFDIPNLNFFEDGLSKLERVINYDLTKIFVKNCPKCKSRQFECCKGMNANFLCLDTDFVFQKNFVKRPVI